MAAQGKKMRMSDCFCSVEMNMEVICIFFRSVFCLSCDIVSAPVAMAMFLYLFLPV